MACTYCVRHYVDLKLGHLSEGRAESQNVSLGSQKYEERVRYERSDKTLNSICIGAIVC